MYLIFDTETNGLPTKDGQPMKDVNNWPRIAQLAWQMYDKDHNLVMSDCQLIKPDGWFIPKEENFLNRGMNKADAKKNAKFFTDNNMSTERCEEYGVPIEEMLLPFIGAYKDSKYLIAHNIEFDYNVTGAEMYRAGLHAGPHKLTRICTMLGSRSFCRIPGKNGVGFKKPRLEELYYFLFKEAIEDAHDAMGDVKTTAKCFFELVTRGIIRLI
jgi:DNA polymerase III alpha subunit (gram-positive type)